MRSELLAALACAAALCAGCPASPFRCGRAVDCNAGSICTYDNACAAPAPACPSGYRYSSSAARAGDCVPAAMMGDAATDVPVDATRDAAADGTLDVTPDATIDASIDAPDVPDAPDATGVIDAPDVIDVPDVIDAPDVIDTGVEVVDAPANLTCGGRGQPCCGDDGNEVACRDGLVCNATSRGTCVEIAREPGECVTTAMCAIGRVCGGPAGCAGRWCYRCQPAGTLPFESTCDEAAGGSTCVSGVCQRGRCTTACSLGAAGEDECARALIGSHCVAFSYGLEVDGGTPARWATLGYCVRGCARAADCSGGRSCVASANLIDDRIDFVCQATARPGIAGAPCTANSSCQSGLCVGMSTTMSVCVVPCAANADCPAPLVCRPFSLTRPVSRLGYAAQGCLPP